MIRHTVTRQLGKRTLNFTFEGENFFDVIMESQRLGFGDLKACGLCGSDNLRLSAYITEKDKYKYVKVICSECKATLTFGRSKTDQDTFFYRKNDAGKYDWQAHVPKGAPRKESVATGAVDDEQIGQSIDTIVPF